MLRNLSPCWIFHWHFSCWPVVFLQKTYKVPLLPNFWSQLPIALHWLLLYMFFSVLCMSSASFWSIIQRHRAWSYKANLTSAADACPFVDPFIPSVSCGPWKVEREINRWHQNKYSRGGARIKTSWIMWSKTKDPDVQWVTFSYSSLVATWEL